MSGIHVYAPAQTSEFPSLCSQKIILFVSFLSLEKLVLGKTHFRKKCEELIFFPVNVMLLKILKVCM